MEGGRGGNSDFVDEGGSRRREDARKEREGAEEGIQEVVVEGGGEQDKHTLNGRQQGKFKCWEFGVRMGERRWKGKIVLVWSSAKEGEGRGTVRNKSPEEAEGGGRQEAQHDQARGPPLPQGALWLLAAV